MVNFSRGSTTIAILLLATTAYGQCEYNKLTTYTVILNQQSHNTWMSKGTTVGMDPHKS